MSLKTSFCNKSVLKSDIKRFWWVGLLETILIFLTNTLPLWYRISDMDAYIPNSAYDVSRLITWENLQFVIPCAFAISVVALLFSYMHQVASVSFYHSMPVTRKSLYITKIISSLILTIAPILINALIIFGLVGTSDANLAEKYSSVFKWIFTGSIYTVLLISLSVFVNMMTGTPIGTVLFTMGFIFLPVLVITFYEFFCGVEVFGFSARNTLDCLEWIYISEGNLLKPSYLLVYLVMTVVFGALGYLLYKKRKLEMYGEVIAFSGLKPVFIGIISFISSMVGYAYLGEVFRNNNIFFIIPLGLLGTIIAWMVSRKSISPKGILKPIVTYLIAALCLIGFVKFDISGFERRIPDSEDVLWADVLDVYNRDVGYLWINNERIEYTVKGKMDTKFYDKEGIESVINMHRYSVENRPQGDVYSKIPIMYKLKNGRTIVREYGYNFERDIDVLKPVYNSKEVRAKRFDLINGSEKDFATVQISDRRIKNGLTFYADNPNLIKVVDALKKDLAEISYEDSMLSSGGSIHINIDYDVVIEPEVEIEDEFELKNYTGRGEAYSINENYPNTMAVLAELGFLDRIPKAEDIVSCNVALWRNGEAERVVVEKDGTSVIYGTDSEKIGPDVTDRAEIEVLYGLYEEIITDKKYTDYNNCINVRVIYQLDDYNFEASCSYDEDKLPEAFKKYM